MASGMDKLAKELRSMMSSADERKPKPYDAQAEVLRIEDDIAWVHIPGGVEETPVRLTINAKKGDMVNIHVANGSAWITGNGTNPPTDDTTALKAINVGETAINYIGQVKESVDVVYILAENAMTSANGKNKVYRQAVAPTGGIYAVGDIWFDTANDNKINRWDGSAWVAFTLGDDALDSISANKLTAGEIDASVITVSNLDAGNITTGNLAADRMKVNSISAINSNTGTVKIQASKVEIDGTAIFNAISDDVDDAITEKGYQTASDVSSAVASGVSGKADKTDAIARQQRIYYRKTASGAPSPNTTWLSTSGTGYGNWSLKIPPLTNGSTKYSYLYTAVQTQTVSQQAAGSTCSCSDVLLDDSTTVIDGGNIITGTVTANQIATNTITANRIRIGDFNNYVTANENDASSLLGANTANSIVDGWIYKSDDSASNLWVSPVLNNWTKESEQYRVTGIVKMTVAGKAKVSIYGRLDNATYSAQSAKETNWVVIPANTETEINETITISSGVAAQPKSNIAIQFQTTDGNTYTGYFKKLRVERMTDADLIVDGSITADKIHANAITIGKMDSSTQSQVLNSNVQIGGRNLLTGTAKSKDLTTAASQNWFNPQPYALSAYADSAIADTNNTQIAVSFDYTITDVDTAFNMTVSLRTTSTSTYAAGFTVASIPIGNSSGRAFGTRDITSAMRQYAQGYGIMVSGSGSGNADAKLTISNVKLEFGNKATDWSLAPEDLQSNVSSAGMNMLLDWDANSLDLKDAESSRYWAGSQSYFNYSFFSISDPPENNIHNGVRCTLTAAQTAEVQTGYAFYSAQTNDVLPFSVGNSYTISCWARCTAGSGRVKLYYRENTTATGVTPVTTLDSTWKRVYGVFTPSVVVYGRVWFYVNFSANTTGTVEMCGFKCVANGDSAEATKYITAIDNNGIRVHAANNPTSNYAKIDANGMEVYKGGNSVAKFGQTVVLSDGTKTLYEIKPLLNGAAKVTRVYNMLFSDDPEPEPYYEEIMLGRTVNTWTSIVVKYKTSAAGSVLTKTYTSLSTTASTIINETNFKFALEVWFGFTPGTTTTDKSRIRISVNKGATLTSSEKLTIVSIQFNFNTTQTAVESTLGAYADDTQSAVFRVGNGLSTSSKSNAFAVDYAGNGFFYGDIYADCEPDSSGGVSLGRVKEIPSAYYGEGSNWQLNIGVYQIGMLCMLDIYMYKNASTSAGGNIFDVDINATDIPMPAGGYGSGMMYYNNVPLGLRILDLGDGIDTKNIRFRVRNCSASAVTVSSSSDGASGTWVYICEPTTAANYY